MTMPAINKEQISVDKYSRERRKGKKSTAKILKQRKVYCDGVKLCLLTKINTAVRMVQRITKALSNSEHYDRQL